MFRWVDVQPILFSKTLKLEDGQRLGPLQRLVQQMRYFLGDGASFAFGSCLQLSVQSIRKIFDVQGSHFSSNIPPLWRQGPRASRRLPESPRAAGRAAPSSMRTAWRELVL